MNHGLPNKIEKIEVRDNEYNEIGRKIAGYLEDEGLAKGFQLLVAPEAAHFKPTK